MIVSDDRWVLQGCPVSGPSLSVDAAGNLKVVWYAAGEGTAAGVYFAESTDNGHSFSPRQLLAQETVRGTPVIAGPTALWQTSETGETKMRSLGNAGTALSVAANAELPAGAYVDDKHFVAYIGKEKEKRSIWLIRAAF